MGGKHRKERGMTPKKQAFVGGGGEYYTKNARPQPAMHLKKFHRKGKNLQIPLKARSRFQERIICFQGLPSRRKKSRKQKLSGLGPGRPGPTLRDTLRI